jgi:peptidoglycan/xylan/chitin deacetylase (PgdA/CDA1 family)
LGNRGPVVSFCFDDFPRTAYTAGGSILRSFGARGTYYAAVALMNTANHLGEQFRPCDLQALMKDGHELANHTFSHISSRAVPISTFQQDVQKAQEAIREITGAVPSGNFAYPYGEVAVAAKRALGAAMASCRGIYDGINGPYIDLNLLLANALYGDTSRLPAVERLIAKSKDEKGWLIFYTHDVSPNPSPFGCTPSLLESAISCAARGGLRISTVAEVLAELEPS